MNFSIESDIFRGPVDLLLYLVRRHEVEVSKIALADVTEKYLEYIDVLKEISIDAIEKKICPTSDPAQKDIPMVPTTDQGIQTIFFDKENQCAWDRWGKDVAKLAVDFGGKVASAAVGAAF